MSMLYAEAVRDIMVIAINKVEKQREWLDVLQPPTKVTEEILESDDPYKAYCIWVESQSNPIECPIYADNDALCEKQIGVHRVDYALEHLNAFRKTVANMRANGYELVFSSQR